MSKRPNILPEVLLELETFGVEPMKIELMSQAGNNRDDLLKSGNVAARRGEIHDWLNWKAEKEERWIRAGVAVSFIAMIAAILAAVFAFLSLPR